jgi:hypothetical protein
LRQDELLAQKEDRIGRWVGLHRGPHSTSVAGGCEAYTPAGGFR